MRAISYIFFSTLMFVGLATVLHGRDRRSQQECGHRQVEDPECSRHCGYVNPFYYIGVRRDFRTYNWRMNPLTVERMLGPQAYMGPTS